MKTTTTNTTKVRQQDIQKRRLRKDWIIESVIDIVYVSGFLTLFTWVIMQVVKNGI